ncbi:pentatricopeptide repeat-containing protein At1g62260, mitochondrial-like [Selaginella moellendorffii]|uniref:pentatricopeptide repeat-containing protein At1g62260, mitochondrial-like n=1 Tax=Selaginella moellendorffii TaxID=88036 RepID=UPI000D1CC63B|nr:pentatricopeptide repeat-containing protein At1g62260, mitochondrial-like [Selaginella moellendorffii]|eukprot:XP_024517437.1 pentatricopeptide repeat-containing protein At1g62260, mitochondrial-like [Selaginella moellendorffii]
MALWGYNPKRVATINSGTLWIGKSLGEHLESGDHGSLDSRSYGELIRQCSSARALEEGRRLHSIIARSDRWRHETFLGNLLVQMYGSCKSLGDAISVFRGMSRRNSFSWNIMIAANAQNGQSDLARDVFRKMPCVDNVSWTSILASLLHSGDFGTVKKIFDEIPERCAVAWNVMLVAYARQGHLLDLIDSFEKMPFRGVDSWNVMIRALDRESAKVVFDRMPGKDVISWNTMLSSCSSSLPSFAMKLDQTKQLFDCMPQHDAISCSTMLSAFAQRGDLLRARCHIETLTRGASWWRHMPKPGMPRKPYGSSATWTRRA